MTVDPRLNRAITKTARRAYTATMRRQQSFMTRISPLRAIAIVAVFLSPSPIMAAEAHPDRLQFNHDIRIEPNDKVGDITCIHCSVDVRGQVSGDVTTVAGNV